MENNLLVLQRLKPADDDKAVLDKINEEAQEGFCDAPRPMTEEDIFNYTLARRIGILEWRDHLVAADGTAGDFGLRNVDHETEPQVNEATLASGPHSGQS